jgi:hypothetical protein
VIKEFTFDAAHGRIDFVSVEIDIHFREAHYVHV